MVNLRRNCHPHSPGERTDPEEPALQRAQEPGRVLLRHRAAPAIRGPLLRGIAGPPRNIHTSSTSTRHIHIHKAHPHPQGTNMAHPHQ